MKVPPGQKDSIGGKWGGITVSSLAEFHQMRRVIINSTIFLTCFYEKGVFKK